MSIACIKSNFILVCHCKYGYYCIIFKSFWRSEYRDLEIYVKSHSRSTEMALFDRSHTSSYSSFIINTSLSSTVSEITSVKYCRDLKFKVRSRSRTLKMVPIDRSCTTLYWVCRGIYSSLSRTNVEIFDVQKMSWPWNLG